MNQRNGLEIAIVGMAGRFPGASNVMEFWQNLRDGVESIAWFTDAELMAAGIDLTLLNQPNYVKARATLADVDLFDAPFFDFNPKEVEITDPQHRLLLESAWSALEQAGYDPAQYDGLVGVYAGAGFNSYLLNLIANPQAMAAVDRFQLMLGNDKDFLSTRVSYKLNLAGPSYTVQTACSTSLVAVHLACRGLLSGDCDMALAGGVTVHAQQTAGYLHHEGGIASPDGHCRAFDAKAQGTVSGSGVGVVVLKRLEDAIADGDTIHAIIKGSAINNDGALKVSYTAPRIDSQATVIRSAQMLAEVEPDSIRYIEAHGTGTVLGDPIEIAALTQAFRGRTERTGFCAIGSVKTNVGHLDTAAGVAGLIKTVLALQHRQIAPSLHFKESNPQIDFANSPFYVNTTLTDWQANGTPRRAGVSSFGIGGTNAHVILEEAPPPESTSPSRPWQLILLSAKTASALETTTTNLVTHLKQNANANLADIAYTLQIGRKALAQRRIAVCRTVEETVQVLETLDSQRVITHNPEPGHRAIAFLFPGQGSQYVGMGQELYETEPVFREQVDRCCQLLEPDLGVDLRSLLYEKSQESGVRSQKRGESCADSENTELTQNSKLFTQNSPPHTSHLTQTRFAQPALFVVEYALAQLWLSWGMQPEALLGHSIGELVAACLAGVFSLKDALHLVSLRGHLMQQCPTGAMLSVPLSEADLQPWLNGELTLAAHNAPSLCVVSGTEEAIAHLQTRLSTQKIEGRRLQMSHAFHSPLMDSVVLPFTEAVRNVALHPPTIPIVSNVTGTWLTATEATDPHYWGQQLRQTVRFAEGMKTLLQPAQILLEVGPGRTLSTLAKQQATPEQVILTSLRHPQAQQSDAALVLHTLGQLWLAGVISDWSGFYAQERRRRVPLPTYPFERQRYWIEPSQPLGSSQQLATLERKSDSADWFYLPMWKRTLPLERSTQKLTESFCWLVFVDPLGLGQQFAQQLEQAEQTVITVRSAEQFSQVSDRAYTLNPQQHQDYETLLQALQTNHQTPQRIVHCWSINPDNGFETIQTHGFYSLIYLTQALAKYLPHTPLQLDVITNDVQDVLGVESLMPHKAMILGACKVIPQEYPHLTCRTIDLDLSQANSSQNHQLLDSLLAELAHAAPDPSVENAIAYRHARRWVQTFEPLPLPLALPNHSRLRQEGVYLIAGDLVDGLGFTLARSLVETWQAKVALVGQTGLPVRSQWQHWLTTHEETNRVSRCIHQVQALEATGAQWLLLETDVTNADQMQQAIAQIDSHFGALHGIIYTPAINAAKATIAIQDINRANGDPEFQSRVEGVQVLEQLLRDRTLDFCLIQSSLSTVLGGLGLATYAASYVYLDAFVSDRNRTSTTPWFSVNRQAWHSEWDTGQDRQHSTAELTMTPQEVWEAIQRVLSMPGGGQVIVSTGDLQARLQQSIHVASIEQPQISQQTTASHHPRPLQTAYVPPGTAVEQAIATIWQELLGIESVGIHDNFFELGGHSLLAIQVTSRLREQFAVELPLKSILFDTPTIAGLAQGVTEQQSQSDEAEIAALLQEVKDLSPDEIQQQLAQESYST